MRVHESPRRYHGGKRCENTRQKTSDKRADRGTTESRPNGRPGTRKSDSARRRHERVFPRKKLRTENGQAGRQRSQRGRQKQYERTTESGRQNERRGTKRSGRTEQPNGGGTGPDRKTDTAGFAPGEPADLPRRQKVRIATAGRGNGSEGERTKTTRPSGQKRNENRTDSRGEYGGRKGRESGEFPGSGVKNAFGENQCTDNGEGKRFGKRTDKTARPSGQKRNGNRTAGAGMAAAEGKVGNFPVMK